jgi:hypothetical protein
MDKKGKAAAKRAKKAEKKRIRREIMVNNEESDTILKNLTAATPLSPETNQRLHALVARNCELQNILKPSNPIPSIPSYEKSTSIKIDFEGEKTSGYCQNCGAPNGGNKTNGKLWCFRCNRPLIVTFKKPPQKPNPKLKGVTVEEQEAFFLRQKQLGIHSEVICK